MADLKILQVCLSRDLPSREERLPNYIYFTYDSLSIYVGSEDAISDNFAIVDNMPEKPVERMIYIVLDGTLHQYIDYTDTVIAEVEDTSEIDLIRKAGTTFFVNGDSKYIDRQSRALVLPFNNGIYELAVSTEPEQKYDNNTIIKYNEETGRFEIYGGKTNTSGGDTADEYEDYSQGLYGKDTASVNTNISGSRIDANIILSKAFDNALRILSDGLYVRSDNKVDKDTFDEFRADVDDFKSYCYALLDNLDANIAYIESIISEESISDEIHSQLEGEIPGVEEMINNYDEVRSRLDSIESECMDYTTTILTEGIANIDQKLETAASWNDLSDNVSEYTHEVNYYDKAKSYDEDLSDEEIEMIMAAISSYITSEIV